jgi:hypothetical protein
MQEWWGNLDGTARFFYGLASFFSVFFLWQMIAAFFGAAGDEADIAAVIMRGLRRMPREAEAVLRDRA